MSVQAPEVSGVEGGESKQSIAPERAQELKDIAAETNRRAEAWGKYAGYGDEYTRRNDERVAVGRAKIDHFGDGTLTMVASINTEKIDPATGKLAENQRAKGLTEGRATDLHDYNPESRNHADIEAAYNAYLAVTPPEERLVVFEGDERSEVDTPDRDSAIDNASETGMMQYFARRDGVPAVTGEPSDQEIAAFVEARGVSREELTLVLMIRNLTHDLGKPLPEDITMQIYGEAVVNGVEGFQGIPENEKQRIVEQNPDMLDALRNQARDLVVKLNADLASLGLPELQLRADGTIGFSSMEDRATLAKAWDPRSEGRLAEIHTMITEARDYHIFNTISDAVQDGKKPFVVYGGSHVMSLEPVMEEYFNEKEQKPEIITEAEKVIEGRKVDHVVTGLEPGQSYEVELTDPSFPFTATVDVEATLTRPTAAEVRQLVPEASDEQIAEYVARGGDDMYREKYLEKVGSIFNGIVAERSLHGDIIKTFGYSLADRMYKMLESRPDLLKNFRGNALFWNRAKEMSPVKPGETGEQHTDQFINERLGMLARYKDIPEWDLLNEPLKREPRLKDGVDQDEVILDPTTPEGLDAMVDLFKRAREINPDTRNYINEYDALSGDKLDEYIELIKQLLERGAPIDGIGVQAHMWEWSFASIDDIHSSLARLAELGIPIKVTEFDVSAEAVAKHIAPAGATPEEVEEMRAQYIKDALTLFYGCPAVVGINLWSFDARLNWRLRDGEQAGLYDDNMQPNQSGRELEALYTDQWRTHEQAVANERGEVHFRGFPGEYSVRPSV